MKYLLALCIATIILYGCIKKGTYTSPRISYESYILKDPAKDSVVFTFYIPSAFTPNGDGENEFWGPLSTGLDPSAYYISILDKTGKVVFESHVPEPFSGAGPNGQLLPEQTFTYYIEAKDKYFGGQHIFKGKFLLLR